LFYFRQFKIDPVSGIIRTTARLNFEAQPRITLMVQAHDNGIPQKNDYAQIIINLLDENDNAPVFDLRQYKGMFMTTVERWYLNLSVKMFFSISGLVLSKGASFAHSEICGCDLMSVACLKSSVP